jgi:bifunctional DNase/RNase
MEIRMIAIEEDKNTPSVILKDSNSNVTLNICIGKLDAVSIAAGMRQCRLPPPMTHDLIKTLISRLEVAVEWIELRDLPNNALYGLIRMRVGGKETEIEARPADALAIALRVNAPIYADERVFTKLNTIQTEEKGQRQDEEARKLTEKFARSLPEDLYRYKM